VRHLRLTSPIELQRKVLARLVAAYLAVGNRPAAVQSQRELRGFAVFDPADLNLTQTAAADENYQERLRY
jgi:hypothetical protein